MNITKTDKAQPGVNGLTASGDELVAVEASAVMAAAGAGDIVVGPMLPAGCVPVDLMVCSDDLDSNGVPTITLTAAILKDDFSDIVAGTEFLIGSTVAQGGGVARADKAAGLRLPPDQLKDRYLGLKIVAGAATFQAGTLSMTSIHRPANGD